MTDNQVPDPEDPDFFAKYTMPQGIRDFAFGPSGGTPPPRVVRSVRRPKTSGSADDRTPPAKSAVTPPAEDRSTINQQPPLPQT